MGVVKAGCGGISAAGLKERGWSVLAVMIVHSLPKSSAGGTWEDSPSRRLIETHRGGGANPPTSPPRPALKAALARE
jgi:hypothetical protein